MSRFLSFLLIAGILCTAAVRADDSNAKQQEKDQETKQRIYGTKYPWQNTAPYGTQYTPPQSGGSVPDSDSGSSAEPAKPAEKPATKAPAKSAKKSHATKTSSSKAKKSVKHSHSH